MRRCRHSECETILTTYNHGDRCYVHTPLMPARPVIRREAKLRPRIDHDPELASEDRTAFLTGEWL